MSPGYLLHTFIACFVGFTVLFGGLTLWAIKAGQMQEAISLLWLCFYFQCFAVVTGYLTIRRRVLQGEENELVDTTLPGVVLGVLAWIGYRSCW